jgi:uncharacterized protein (DUF1697 family)
MARGDGFDIEALEHLVEGSAAWERIRARLEQALATAVRDLKTAELDKVARLQERIATLEMVLALPRQLIGELRAAAKKGGQP